MATANAVTAGLASVPEAHCAQSVEEADALGPSCLELQTLPFWGKGAGLASVKERFTLSLCSGGFSTTAKEGSCIPKVVPLSPQPASKAFRILEKSEVDEL